MVKGKKWANPVFPTRRICVATKKYLLTTTTTLLQCLIRQNHPYLFILSFIHYDLQHLSFFIHSFSCVYDPVVTGTNMINEEEGDRYLPPTKNLSHILAYTDWHQQGFGRFRLVRQVGLVLVSSNYLVHLFLTLYTSTSLLSTSKDRQKLPVYHCWKFYVAYYLIKLHSN